eukprot:8217202-Pyramimonas_sp.AAC.2
MYRRWPRLWDLRNYLDADQFSRSFSYMNFPAVSLSCFLKFPYYINGAVGRCNTASAAPLPPGAAPAPKRAGQRAARASRLRGAVPRRAARCARARRRRKKKDIESGPPCESLCMPPGVARMAPQLQGRLRTSARGPPQDAPRCSPGPPAQPHEA